VFLWNSPTGRSYSTDTTHNDEDALPGASIASPDDPDRVS